MASDVLEHRVSGSLPYKRIPDGEVVVGYHKMHGWRCVVVGHPFAGLGVHMQREAVLEARSIALSKGLDRIWIQDVDSPVVMCNKVSIA